MGYWAYLQQTFTQDRAFEPGQVPDPAVLTQVISTCCPPRWRRHHRHRRRRHRRIQVSILLWPTSSSIAF